MITKCHPIYQYFQREIIGLPACPFSGIMHDPDSTALLLYPTKALANDQLSPFQDGFNYLKEHGNTLLGLLLSMMVILQFPKKSIRNNSSFLLTNPDMLHISILPHHTAWKRFLSNLRFIVIDEVHVYKGVFALILPMSCAGCCALLNSTVETLFLSAPVPPFMTARAFVEKWLSDLSPPFIRMGLLMVAKISSCIIRLCWTKNWVYGEGSSRKA
jgi:hypothetical protein